MDAFNTVRGIVQAAVAAYGAWLVIKGAVTLGGGFASHQSTEMRDGGAQLIGGAIVCAAAYLVGTISVG